MQVCVTGHTYNLSYCGVSLAHIKRRHYRVNLGAVCGCGQSHFTVCVQARMCKASQKQLAADNALQIVVITLHGSPCPINQDIKFIYRLAMAGRDSRDLCIMSQKLFQLNSNELLQLRAVPCVGNGKLTYDISHVGRNVGVAWETSQPTEGSIRCLGKSSLQ